MVSLCSFWDRPRIVRRKAYIFPDDRSKTSDPHQALACHSVEVQALAAEHGLCEALALVLFHHALRACQERVLAYRPRLIPSQADVGDVAERWGREQQFARPREG